MSDLEKLLSRRISFLLGKNGCGKSTLLRDTDERLATKSDGEWFSRYIPPERGGFLLENANVEEAMKGQKLERQRRTNYVSQFRQQSYRHFKELEVLILREIEKQGALRSNPSFTFDTVVGRITELLYRINVMRGGSGFTLAERDGVDGVPRNQFLAVNQNWCH